MSHALGYGCWGFLGDGITDTPDGGRSHRGYLIRTLINSGFDVIMLQMDRDRLEAGQSIPLSQTYDTGFPPLDVLFLEWLWKIPNRNDRRGIIGGTPDWFRQRDLLAHYAGRCPIIIWDKDQTLDRTPAALQKLLQVCDTFVLEPSLYPLRPDRTRALFPFDPTRFNMSCEQSEHRHHPLIYIGNDYQRRRDFRKHLVPVSSEIDIWIFGKWPIPIKDDRIRYEGRIPYSQVKSEYGKAITTFLLAPPRYKKSGQFTQRIYEALCEGCLPLAARDYVGVARILEPSLIIESSQHIPEKIEWLRNLSRSGYESLLEAQRKRLHPFSSEEIVKTIHLAMANRLPRFGRSTPLRYGDGRQTKEATDAA